MAICPIICSFYYLARALMHDVVGEIACAEGCAETISANVLKFLTFDFHGENEKKRRSLTSFQTAATTEVLFAHF